MLDHERTVYAWVLDYAQRLTADIDEAKMTHQPASGMNTPLWVLGHLAIATDYAAGLLGLPMACPKEWHKAFGPGSNPAVVPSPCPTKAELLAALAAGHARVSEATKSATAEQLAQLHTIDLAPLKEMMPRVGDLLVALMTTHAAMHLGQLSAWRRLNGLGAVMGI